MRSLLKDVAQVTLDDFTQKSIKGKVWQFWLPFQLEEKQHGVIQEYYSKYTDILPPLIREFGVNALFHWFPEALEAHPYIVQRIRASMRAQHS